MWLRRYNVFHQIAKKKKRKKESVSSINISPQEPTKKPLATNISDEHMSEHYQRQCERNDFKVTGVFVYTVIFIFFLISTQKKCEKRKKWIMVIYTKALCVSTPEREPFQRHGLPMRMRCCTHSWFLIFFSPCITLQSGKSAKIWKALLITFKTGPRDKLQWLGRE